LGTLETLETLETIVDHQSQHVTLFSIKAWWCHTIIEGKIIRTGKNRLELRIQEGNKDVCEQLTMQSKKLAANEATLFSTTSFG
jgi:hypothetical protein